jgi:5-methyltetrahydrofolate--homocysteine methyltransferase
MINDIATRLKDRILILDGAMGTILQNQGMQPGDCPEWFGIQNPGLLEEIHYQYVQAGADIIQTNTFGANRCKLNEFGLADQVQEINAEAVRIARQAARDKALVAASIGPTGKMLHPLGDADFDFLYQVFGEQAVACEKAGAQLISIETMSDIGEMRAALIAVRQNTRLPIIAHMTFENSGRTMMGTDPLTALLILEALQPMAIGANCSGGARELLPVMETMGRYARTFLSVEPNAGMPQLINGHTVFPDAPEEMAEYALKLREAGANIIGGCCGTTPDHIQAMARALQGIPPLSRKKQGLRGLASRSRCTLIGEDYPLAFIGERINPTARKKLAQDIKEGSMQMVVEEARKQCLSGAPILDINMGVPGIDEATAMKKAVIQVQTAVDLPLSIDSVNFEAIENGLKNFVGRALINSTSGEEKQLSRILPLAKKYGAAVLGLCLDENGIPDKAEGRLEIARRIYNQAREYGLRDEDIYIDGLVKTASAEQSQVMETLKALQLIKRELPVNTASLSHISLMFGEKMPDIGCGAIAIISSNFKHNRYSPGSISFINYLFQCFTIQFSGSLFYSPANIFIGHINSFGFLNSQFQLGIGVRVSPTPGFYGNSNLLGYFSKFFTLLFIGAGFLMFNRRPFGMSRHFNSLPVIRLIPVGIYWSPSYILHIPSQNAGVKTLLQS